MSAARRLDLIGVPYNSAGTTDGVARAPGALRRAGLVKALTLAGLDVSDRGDVELPTPSPERDPDSHAIAGAALQVMIGRTRRAVAESFARGAFPLVLGGDCPILLGCLGAATARRGGRVLFVDGHEDAWPPARSTTGEAADMELGWLLGLNAAGLPANLRAEIPILEPGDVIVLGARDEQELADAGVESIGGIVRIVRPDAIADAPESVGGEAASTLSGRGPWWLHVDLDVLAIDSLAAVDYRQDGGLDWPALTGLTRGALASPGVLGWDITIYNPNLDPNGGGAMRIVRYIVDVLGRRD